MSETGWRDPRSPEYQQDERDNEFVKEAFADFDGPFHLYRSTYKYTPCGPTVGMTFQKPEGGVVTVYCDSLPATWKELDDKGWLVVSLHVSSIVEGIDACTDSHEIGVADYETPRLLAEAYWNAVEDVDNEADALWQNSHGCPTCAKHWLDDPDDWKGADDERWDCGDTVVWIDCPECGGSGTVI